VLEAQDLAFSYGDFPVFEHVNLEVNENGFVVVVGPSGAGKSTLLRVLGGFLRPTRGKVLLMGEEVTRPSPKIMMVHQAIVTFPWMTVLENVMMGAEARGLPKEAARQVALQMIEVVGLRGFEDFYPKQLSGGMRQRVAIARALAADPVVLLMDEPFAHLDELTAERLRREIYDILFSEGSTLESVVLVSHNLNEVVELSDRVYAMRGSPARIVGELTIELERPRNQYNPIFSEYVSELYSMLSIGE
jgi:ABC-type nitrate/sulfonate/bicarbonate transport system, ATPase component